MHLLSAMAFVQLKSEHNQPTDNQLWTQIRSGDEEAFSMLFLRYNNSLYTYGSAFCDDHELVKDCIQDVFVHIWDQRYKLVDVLAVKAYLIACVRRKVLLKRKKERDFRNILKTDYLHFSYQFEIDYKNIESESTLAKITKLNTIINQLPSRQKEALHLRYHHGLSVDQIAEILEMNYQSAKNLLYRCILGLRKEFGALLTIFLLPQ
jgi:RNA polymerase sigma factor (sigma-70 family)